jgi:hypothetical protein
MAASAITEHPAFARLVQLEAQRRRMLRRPGGRDALAANSTACFQAEHEILRGTGCTFNQMTGAVLTAGRA